ncbi:MAG: hypothetical protein HW375_33 [Anaerolineales bacterium]|nr:hypothetical protein [Anaerolineales bacterium]
MPTNIPPLLRRRPYTTRSIGRWWMGRPGTVVAAAAGIDFEFYEGGVLVGGTLTVSTLEVYESGVLVGDVAGLTVIEVYEGGVLVGSVP